jgi:hypothetical protein
VVEGISFFEVYFIIQEYNLYRIRTSEAKVKLHAQEFISIAKIITIYHITKHALQFLALLRNWWDYSENSPYSLLPTDCTDYSEKPCGSARE